MDSKKEALLDHYGIYDAFNRTLFKEQPQGVQNLFQHRAEAYDRIQAHIHAKVSTSRLENWFLSFWYHSEAALAKDIQTYQAINQQIKTDWRAYKISTGIHARNLDTMVDHKKKLDGLVTTQLMNQTPPSKLHDIATYLHSPWEMPWEKIISNIDQEDYVTQQIARKIHAMYPKLKNPFPEQVASASFDWRFFYHMATSVYNAVIQLASTATAQTSYARIPTDLEEELKLVKPSDSKIATNLDKYLVAKSMESCLTTGNPSWYEVCEIAAEHRGWETKDTTGSFLKKTGVGKEKGFSLKDYLTSPWDKLPEPLKAIAQFHDKIQSLIHSDGLTKETSEILEKIQQQLRTIPKSNWESQDLNDTHMLAIIDTLIKTAPSREITHNLNNHFISLSNILKKPGVNTSVSTLVAHSKLSDYVERKKSELGDALSQSSPYQSR